MLFVVVSKRRGSHSLETRPTFSFCSSYIRSVYIYTQQQNFTQKRKKVPSVQLFCSRFPHADWNMIYIIIVSHQSVLSIPSYYGSRWSIVSFPLTFIFFFLFSSIFILLYHFLATSCWISLLLVFLSICRQDQNKFVMLFLPAIEKVGAFSLIILILDVYCVDERQ